MNAKGSREGGICGNYKGSYRHRGWPNVTADAAAIRDQQLTRRRRAQEASRGLLLGADRSLPPEGPLAAEHQGLLLREAKGE